MHYVFVVFLLFCMYSLSLFLRCIRLSLLFVGSDPPRCNRGAFSVGDRRYGPPKKCWMLYGRPEVLPVLSTCDCIHPMTCTILQKKKRKKKLNEYTTKSMIDCLLFSLPKSPWLFFSVCLVPGTRYYHVYSHLFVDRHNKKTAGSKGQTWRLNKSACNSGNATIQP